MTKRLIKGLHWLAEDDYACTLEISRREARDILALVDGLAEARYNARVIAHSYKTGNNPPQRVVTESLGYPVDTRRDVK